jgi:selenide,water dikinase
VYRLSDDLALVQTVDFFSPVVDDPYDCGQIVAANCLSDCYAMGGRPLCAMNVVGWPRMALPVEVVTTLLRGGQDAFQAAGVTLVGGHSMYSQELFYGAAITGLIHPRRIVTNAKARPGDHLVLTKPLGTGIVAYAIHGRLAPTDIVARATAVMKRLNREASEAMVELGAHAATDITGYGLCGHAFEMAEASGVSLHIEAERLPLLEGLEPLLDRLGETMGQRDNQDLCGDKVSVADSVPRLLRAVCFDPQTSGGLLVSLPGEGAGALVRRLRGEGVEASVIGRVTAQEQYCVLVE